MSSPKNITVRRKCTRCGHEQDVKSAVAFNMRPNNKTHYYFGSKYDFCDKCDGPMVDAKRIPLKGEDMTNDSITLTCRKSD